MQTYRLLVSPRYPETAFAYKVRELRLKNSTVVLKIEPQVCVWHLLQRTLYGGKCLYWPEFISGNISEVKVLGPVMPSRSPSIYEAYT